MSEALVYLREKVEKVTKSHFIQVLQNSFLFLLLSNYRWRQQQSCTVAVTVLSDSASGTTDMTPPAVTRTELGQERSSSTQREEDATKC